MKTRYRLDEHTGDVLFEGKYLVGNPSKWEWNKIRIATIQELLFKFGINVAGEKDE